MLKKFLFCISMLLLVNCPLFALDSTTITAPSQLNAIQEKVVTTESKIIDYNFDCAKYFELGQNMGITAVSKDTVRPFVRCTEFNIDYRK